MFSKKNNYGMKKILGILTVEIFYILTASLFIFTCLELIWPRLILAYINLNMILIFWLVFGIFIVVSERLGTR